MSQRVRRKRESNLTPAPSPCNQKQVADDQKRVVGERGEKQGRTAVRPYERKIVSVIQVHPEFVSIVGECPSTQKVSLKRRDFSFTKLISGLDKSNAAI